MKIGVLALCGTLILITLLFDPILIEAKQSSVIEDLNRDITIEDFRGKTIVLNKPAERIVCLIESALSGIYMLWAENRLVGISTNVYQEETFRYYAQMDERIRNRTMPTPGNWDFVNLEKVISLNPDLVIIWAHQIEAIQALESRSIPVFGVFIKTFEDVYREVLALGVLTDTNERARELVSTTRQAIDDVKNKTSQIPVNQRFRVYFMWAQGELETSGRPSSVDELITIAGGINVSGTIAQEHTVVHLENLLEWDPQLIVMWYNQKKDPEDIFKLSAWQSLSALKNQRVYEFPDIFSCDLWTLKFEYAVKLLASWCYPQMFQYMDLNREKDVLFRRLYGERSFPN